MAIEEWKPVINFEKLYEISNFGRIKSLDRDIYRRTPRDPLVFFTKTYYGKLLTPSVEKNKENKPLRCFVSLSKNNKVYHKRIHRLVLESFVGPCPEGMEGCHNDGNALNNNIENLRWDTGKENQKDRINHKTFYKDDYFAGSSFRKTDILMIRKLVNEEGKKIQFVADLYNVHWHTISKIINRKTWKHV